VRIADVGREEFEEAHRGALAGGRDDLGHRRRTMGTSVFMPFGSAAKSGVPLL
jgi:hypothetical protein